MCKMEPVHSVEGLWRIDGGTTGYLWVRGGKSLLIDCPSADMAELLRNSGLPLPELILNTQVQEEHCRQWAAFPSVETKVFAGSLDVAVLSDEFIASYTGLWENTNWETERGIEQFGFAGCVTERPPVKPLNAAAFQDGDAITWQGITLQALALPGVGRRACGFFAPEQGILFSGDLIWQGGSVMNLYDIERSYGFQQGYAELRRSLLKVKTLSPQLLLPSSGPVITEPARDIATLLQKLDRFEGRQVYRKGREPAMTNYEPVREAGRYKLVLPGIVQNNNYGNMILFIDDDGIALLVDPDPCVWSTWEENIAAVHSDFDLLEREFGLKRVEKAVITHYHGDHVRFCGLVRERYGAEILATPDIAALMEHPMDFPYPCRIPWYNLPFSTIRVDGLLEYEKPFRWHGGEALPIHTPGHCNAHAGYYLKWRGHRIVCTGDMLQYGDGPISEPMPIIYNDNAWPPRGNIASYRRMKELNPDVVLGGHSFSFFDTDGSILNDWIAAAEESLRLATELVYDKDVLKAMTPPGYDGYRDKLQSLNKERPVWKMQTISRLSVK